MTKKRILVFSGLSLLVLTTITVVLLATYYARLPSSVSEMETLVFGQTRFTPGSEAAIRVVVRDRNQQAPIPEAELQVRFEPESGGRGVVLFEGTTNEQGTADVSFPVPDDLAPEQKLVIETVSSLGKDVLEQSVSLERDYKVLLTTDKPIYQPGQTIHVRALVLSTFDLLPAVGGEVEFIVADAKGNKVFRQSAETSEFGIGSLDFQLAMEVNTGPYKISASMGNTSSERTVTVERYLLPKFDLSWKADKRFYLPGEYVHGSLDATYFYGKTVAGGEVNLEGYTFDFERQVYFTLQGRTDSEGHFDFEFRMPEYIVGTEFEGGAGRFYLEASVTDLANHTETSNYSLPVSQNGLIVEAIPESGQIRPGVENILYVLTSYPDGTPAQSALSLRYEGHQTQLQTGEFGLAEFRFTPSSPWLEIFIIASDAQGAKVEVPFYFEGNWEDETILLRPDKAVYPIGDTMTLDVLTTMQVGTIFLDIVRAGQTMSTRSIPVSGGRAAVAIDITPDLYGSIEIHAYLITSWGGVIRDTRVVVIDTPSDLHLDIHPDQAEYRPGDQAELAFHVAGENGEGVLTALGLSIVDESVFALAEQDPGFAKLYFMLEESLLVPRYDIHGFSVPDLLGEGPESPELIRAIEGAAQASLADTVVTQSPFGLQLNSFDHKVEDAYARQVRFFNSLVSALFVLGLAIPIGAFGLAVWTAMDEKVVISTFAITLILIFALLMIVMLIPVPEWVGVGVLDRTGYFLEYLLDPNPVLALALLIFGILGLIALTVRAIRKKEWKLGLGIGLTLLLIPWILVLSVVGMYSNLEPTESILLLVLLTYLLLPLAYVLRSSVFLIKLDIGWSLIAFFVAPFMFILFLIPASVGTRMGGVVAGGEFAVEGQLMEEMAFDMALPEAAPEEFKEADQESSRTGVPTGEPPRLRQFFPETMYWLPEAVTDSNGNLSLTIPLADSITTWRLTALASSQDGRLGANTYGLRVFQDFFIDLDLPLGLTQGDEISVPVGVFNYMQEEQVVELIIEEADWFELLDESHKQILIGGNDIEVVYFRVKAEAFGDFKLKVTAIGSRMSDAIQKSIKVYPDGREIPFSYSDRLNETGITQSVHFPELAIAGTQNLVVKIYPGMVSQVVEGLDSILRMPYGCFEQTSSTTYPNVLALDYMLTTGQISPEVQFVAQDYINLGYQRLTTFEVSGGGFSLFGDPPADRMLTAYGLQEFSDMSQVHPVDPAIQERAAAWLLAQQESDGSWQNDQGLVHESTWSNLENDRLPVTAYVVWSLIEAGFGGDPQTQVGLDYLREHYPQANDPYVLALVANALVAADLSADGLQDFTQEVLTTLANLAQFEGEAAYWSSTVATFMGSEGATGSIETTGLASFALIRANQHPEVANAALTFLIQQKDNFGTWYSTQATVLALKAMLESVRIGGEDIDATVTIRLNQGQERTLQIDQSNFDVVQLVQFDDIRVGAENIVSIEVEGQGELMYQVSGSYYLPWAQVSELGTLEMEELIDIQVHYDRTELQVNDTLQVTVSVQMKQAGRAEWALIDLGIPPGFKVIAEDLRALVTRFQDVPEDYPYATVERFELTGRQILVYIGGLSNEEPLTFSFRLQAKFPISAQTPASRVYDYYNPDQRGEQPPMEIVVLP